MIRIYLRYFKCLWQIKRIKLRPIEELRRQAYTRYQESDDLTDYTYLAKKCIGQEEEISKQLNEIEMEIFDREISAQVQNI